MQQSTGPIGKLKSSSKVVNIYGAGISGLLMGHYLKKNGYNVAIFEKDNRVGGKIGTVQTEDGIAETAANAVFTNDDVFELLQELKLDSFAAKPKLKKFIWRNGKALSPPVKFFEIIKIIFSLGKKIDKTNIETKTVYDFFQPLLGDKFCNEVVSAGLGGIYAEDAKKLHFLSIFKTPITAKTYFGHIKSIIKAKKAANKTKATSLSFEGGMQTLIDTLEESLKEDIQVGTCPALDHNQNNIICTDAIDAGDLLSSMLPDVAKDLKQIEYSTMYTTTLILNYKINFLENAFGVLFPKDSGFYTSGVLHNTSIFPNRVKREGLYSYTLMVKEAGKDIDECISKDIHSLTGKDLSELLVQKQITPWKRAIPVYDLNRYMQVMALRAKFIEKEEGLVLFGNYIDGISIREMVSMAKQFSINA